MKIISDPLENREQVVNKQTLSNQLFDYNINGKTGHLYSKDVPFVVYITRGIITGISVGDELLTGDITEFLYNNRNTPVKSFSTEIIVKPKNDWYVETNIQPWDIIDYCRFNFDLGNALKYFFRLGKKTTDVSEDFAKMQQYLDRFVTKNVLISGKCDDVKIGEMRRKVTMIDETEEYKSIICSFIQIHAAKNDPENYDKIRIFGVRQHIVYLVNKFINSTLIERQIENKIDSMFKNATRTIIDKLYDKHFGGESKQKQTTVIEKHVDETKKNEVILEINKDCQDFLNTYGSIDGAGIFVNGKLDNYQPLKRLKMIALNTHVKTTEELKKAYKDPHANIGDGNPRSVQYSWLKKQVTGDSEVNFYQFLTLVSIYKFAGKEEARIYLERLGTTHLK
jgi:ribosomal protein S20